ncbi:MAG: hypothetical protein ABFS41_20455, partial [Myxococcota bacterium]
AWKLLERFRAHHRPASVESLRAGEARRWAELLGRYDPAHAERFARDELAADPLSPALWHLWARSLAGTGRHREALRAFRAISTLVADPAIERDHAVLLANVENDLSALRALDAPSDEDDPEWVMRRGLALARGTAEERRRGLEDARRIWARRAEHALPERGLGRRLALALAREGLADEARAVLEEAAADERDPVRRALLEGARHLLR